MDRRELLIALNRIDGLGPSTIRRLTEAFKSPEDLFQASHPRLSEILGRFFTPSVSEAFARLSDGKALKEELTLCRQHGAQIVTLLDETYPEPLKNIPDPPPVLYVRGMLLKEDFAAVAMVGTRSASPYGLRFAQNLACELAHRGLTIVSGLAEGIDAASHEGALQAQGRTLAVLGHGLSRIYPTGHEDLARRIADSGGLISEFPIQAPPKKDHFPRRNRVISGLSLGVIVVEAPLKSGALITAREALEQGREVFAVPGPATSLRSQGCHELLKDGAKLVEKAEDVFEELAPHLTGWLTQQRRSEDRFRVAASSGASSPSKEGSVLFPHESALSKEESEVYEAIPVGTGIGVEMLSRQTPLPLPRLLSVLTDLELKGLVQQIPGQGYSRL